MTIVSRVFLCVVLHLAFASFALAQEPDVKVVRTPSGRLELLPMDATDRDIEAARRSKTKAVVDALRSALQGKTFWLRRYRYEPLKCVGVLADKADEQYT